MARTSACLAHCQLATLAGWNRSNMTTAGHLLHARQKCALKRECAVSPLTACHALIESRQIVRIKNYMQPDHDAAGGTGFRVCAR